MARRPAAGSGDGEVEIIGGLSVAAIRQELLPGAPGRLEPRHDDLAESLEAIEDLEVGTDPERRWPDLGLAALEGVDAPGQLGDQPLVGVVWLDLAGRFRQVSGHDLRGVAVGLDLLDDRLLG